MTVEPVIRPSFRNRASAYVAAIACVFALVAPFASAEDAPAEEGDKHVSGMSIVGNDESPKSLVIVPWKSSDLSGDLDPTRRFGQDRSPLDPEVFGRALDYHAIRTGQDR